jgi:hypothetical protein
MGPSSTALVGVVAKQIRQAEHLELRRETLEHARGDLRHREPAELHEFEALAFAAELAAG